MIEAAWTYRLPARVGRILLDRPREMPPRSTDLASAYKQYIETCLEAFGVNRSMFQSNFPPDGVSSSYPISWFKRLAAGYSASGKTELFSGIAKRVYRLVRAWSRRLLAQSPRWRAFSSPSPQPRAQA